MRSKTGNEPYLIGLCGPDCVGKSTTARAIQSAYATLGSTALIQSFATPLYATLSAMVGAPVFELKKNKTRPFEQWLPNCPKSLYGKTPRKMLRWLGTEVVRKDIGDEFWVERAMSEALNSGTDYIIFDDARFPSEYVAMDVVVQLSREGVDYSEEHSSDSRPEEHYVDIVFCLDGKDPAAVGSELRTHLFNFLSKHATSTFRKVD